MAIDADVRAGTIDAAEARRRRRALERESQLSGAMDGALKFVTGTHSGTPRLLRVLPDGSVGRLPPGGTAG